VEPNLPQIELDQQNGAPSAAPGVAPPRWASYLLPSAADLIFVLVVGAMSCGLVATRLLGDAGTGWHIRNGQLILRSHSVPHADPFSASTNGRPWYAWEWMYDAAIAAAHQRLGLNGVVFFSAVVIGLTFALLFRLLLRRGTLRQVAVIFFLLSLIASSIHFFARPHVLSWLFTLIWFESLDSAELAAGSAAQRRLFWLPVLMLFWVNLHGGFVLGFVLLALYFLSGLIDFFRAAGEARQFSARRLRELGAVTGLSLVASVVNPYGYNLHVHVYRYLSDRWLMNHIDEFLAPNFHGIPQQCFAALLLITILTLAVARERIRLSHLSVVMLAASSGLYASRNLPVASILLAVIAGPLLSKAIFGTASNADIPPGTLISRFRSFASRMGNLETDLRGHLWPVAAVICGLMICANSGRLFSWQVMDAHFDAKRFPVEAAGVIAERGIHDPIFTLDSWGGYLIYRLYPHTRVFVDDRHDLYGSEFLKEYLKTIRVEPGWDALLTENHVNWVLVPKESPLANALRGALQWRVFYEDGTAVLFQRR
jgi:hypothetical protein